MSSQMSKLEKSLIDLGAEVFKLRHEVAEMRDLHAYIVETVNGLRVLLQDKGSITADDLDSVAAGIDLMSVSPEPLEHQVEETDPELLTRKRLSH